jgi:hypothetical protein
MLMKLPVVAVICGGKGSLTYRPLLATKLICPSGENKAKHTYFLQVLRRSYICKRRNISKGNCNP